jgi:hypothetical protein
MSQHGPWGKKTTLLIPTATKNQPKPKKQTHPNDPMGWENSDAPILMKREKNKLKSLDFLQLKENCFLVLYAKKN